MQKLEGCYFFPRQLHWRSDFQFRVEVTQFTRGRKGGIRREAGVVVVRLCYTYFCHVIESRVRSNEGLISIFINGHPLFGGGTMSENETKNHHNNLQPEKYAGFVIVIIVVSSPCFIVENSLDNLS